MVEWAAVAGGERRDGLLPLERVVGSTPLLSWGQVGTVALPAAWAALLALTLLGALPDGAYPGADAAAVGLLVAWVALQLLRRTWWGPGDDAPVADRLRATSPRRLVVTTERVLLLGRTDAAVPLGQVAGSAAEGRGLRLTFTDGSSIRLGHIVASSADPADLVRALERWRGLLRG